MSTALWHPSQQRIAQSNLTAFMSFVSGRHDREIADYVALYSYSIAEPASFWADIWFYSGIVGEIGPEPYLVDGDKMPGAEFFPGARLNFAENLLRRADDGAALVFWGEDKVKRRVSWRELGFFVSRTQQAMRAAGIGAGDRVAAMMPNMPETVIAMLAATSLGAIWSSCSPDFGVQGALDRFGQIEPKLLIACDGYYYAGKRLSIAEKLGELVPQLPSLTKTLVVSYIGEADTVAKGLPGAVSFDRFIAGYVPRKLRYERLPFDHSLYIMFSSGTTGIPKCIVHSAGGTLIQHLKEHKLHCDLKPGDRLFYFTTCGWMMWNWLVTGLAAETTLLLYDGSPIHPSGNILFDFADAEKMTFFGTSAKYIDALKKADMQPCQTHDLSSVKAMASTGSPLVPESFDYVYRSIKPGLHLASVSGGTDILSCFVIGNPLKPVYRGEIQGPGLAMAVDVVDENARHLASGKGELVCRNSFPAMPVGFWNDSDGLKYHNAYFARFPGLWHHGDFAEWTEHGGIIIHGRSDATLNPGGVRIGTAEIYRQVEQLEEIQESIVIGQNWDNDVRVVLFVVMKAGHSLTEDLQDRIRKKIRTGASPRHVPAKIIQVADIPRTKSGKITELAVRELVHGREVKNQEALANPEALELYRGIEALSS